MSISSDWMAKHSTVLNDQIEQEMVEPRRIELLTS